MYTGNTTQNSVVVSVGGVTQTPGTNFTISGSNNIITFASPPPNNSTVLVQNLSGGLIGQTGYQGSAGAPGGSTGYTGSQGVGFTGSAGTTGYTGSTAYSIPISNQPAPYIAANTDNGQLVIVNAGTVTINSGIFTPGQNFSIYNSNNTTSQTITQGTGVNLQLAGTLLVGNRSLSQRGFATVICVAANTFIISGAGVT